MKRAAIVFLLGIACLIAAGPQAMGRLALLLGWPGVAGALLSDPAGRGLALFRSGDYVRADDRFAAAGRSQTFNRGLSLAATGQHELSVAYFDAVLFSNPADAEARRLRDLVAAMTPPVRGDSIAPGRISAAGGLSGLAQAETLQAGVQDPEWQRTIEARAFVASDDWLATIGDDPGAFLRLRLQAEYDRRSALGLIRPGEGSPW